MTKRVSFLQMFSQYSPPAPLEELLAQAAIQNAELDMEERAIFLELQCAAYIPRRLLDGACRDLREPTLIPKVFRVWRSQVRSARSRS